jgi:hypothetical protein
MNNGIREISCEELRNLAEQYPMEVSVIREMLDEVDEECLEEAA